MNFVVIYPNNDSGSNLIVDALDRLRGHPRFALLPSMRFEYYLSLLKHATTIVGNSSSGIHEAPVYGVPTVNVGTRQENRFLHDSILNVPEEADAILNALRNLPQSVEPTRHFGSGNSANLFLQHLRTDALWETPNQKQFRDAQFPMLAMGMVMVPAPMVGTGRRSSIATSASG